MDFSSTSTTRTARVEDLQAENAVLRRQLKEAQVFILPSLEASAAASLGAVEDLKMQNRQLLKTVKVLQEEIATLSQTQSRMEQVVQDNDLQKKYQEMSGRMMLLIDDNDHLRNQLSEERERLANAEEHRCAQQELFQRMFMQIKHDMDHGNSKPASVAMKGRGAPVGEHPRPADEQHVFPRETGESPASQLFTEDKCKDDMTHARGMIVLAEGSFPSAAPRRGTRTQPTLDLHYLDAGQ
jgi:hypothetical protein